MFFVVGDFVELFGRPVNKTLYGLKSTMLSDTTGWWIATWDSLVAQAMAETSKSLKEAAHFMLQFGMYHSLIITSSQR